MALEPFIGEIMMFGGSFNPRGWALCNGQFLSIAQNTALFSILGTTYGGNGTTTFALPDLRGRSPMHWGSGSGLSPRALGERDGSESVTLTPNNLPAHQHAISLPANLPCHSQAGSSDTPAGGIPAASATDENYSAPASANGQMAPITIAGNTGITGSSVPVPIMQPFLCITFVIALQGIFPSRN